MGNKKIIFTNHAKERALQRLDIKHNRFSLLFDVEIKKIFKKSVKTVCTNDKVQYESIHNNKKIIFICDENCKEIIVNTIIVKHN